MGNKQGHELTPEEKQRLKDEKEREKRLLKEEKDRKRREKKDEKRRKKLKKKGGADVLGDDEGSDSQSVGSSQWSEKSQGSAPGSWYHSASEPSSKRSSIYMPASAGPGYYQHDCWYSGYEDSGSEKSKPPSRAGSVKDHTVMGLRAGSLERYPLGVPTGEPIEPIHRGGSLDFSSVMAKTYLREREKQMLAAGLEDHNVIASHYDETIRASRDKLERMNVEKLTRLEQKANLSDRSPIMTSASGGRSPLVERPTNVSSGPETADEGSDGRGAKRKAGLEHDQESLRSSVYYSADESSNQDPKRRSLDRFSIDRASLTGSVYYSADEGASVAGSIYYSATSGSEIEDHGVDDDEYFGAERPSAPGRPEAVDREGGILSELAYIKVETDALLLRWNPPETDGGTPITGYIIERCEGNSDFWVRVNLVPAKDTEYAVASLTGGRDYKFRVSAENAVGLSDPSEPSDPVTISGDVEATEPHLLKELRDVVAVQNQRVEFSVDIIATPKPDVTWFKDGFEIYDTTRYEFIADGDRYVLVVKSAELSDEGDIRVRATNKAGVTSSQASVVVQAPPRISLPGEYEQGLIFDTDELIRLRVPYMARPKPEAYWQHNGREIKPNDRYAMDVSEKYATLKIAGACRKDKGMYNLRLTNPQGSVATSFFVTVTDRPDPPGHPTVTDITGTSITLRWEPPQDDGGCRVSNYIVEYYRVGWDVWLKAASSRITWTQLGELIIGSEYKFRVKAENAYGVSEAGPESQPILIDDSKSPSGSFEYETFKSTTPIGTSLLTDSTLVRGESSSMEYPSGGSSEVGSFDVPAHRLHLLQTSSDEKPPSIELEGSMDRGPSFEVGSVDMEAGSLDRPDYYARQFASSLEGSGSYDPEISIEITGSDEAAASFERGDSYDLGGSFDRERLLAAGSFEGSVELGESLDLGGSRESDELPVPPPRSPRRGGRSPAMPPSPFAGKSPEERPKNWPPIAPPRRHRQGVLSLVLDYKYFTNNNKNNDNPSSSSSALSRSTSSFELQNGNMINSSSQETGNPHIRASSSHSPPPLPPRRKLNGYNFDLYEKWGVNPMPTPPCIVMSVRKLQI